MPSAIPSLGFDTIPRFARPLQLRGFGAQYFGGETRCFTGQQPVSFQSETGQLVWPQDGHFSVGQLYAQMFLPAQARTDTRLVFWHGGGLSGAQWESTPDGRPGWLHAALEAGFDTVVCDAPERGRAGIPHPAAAGGACVYRSNELAWEGFRIGPAGGYSTDLAACTVYDTQKFPHEYFDAFSRMFTARWPKFTRDIEAAYECLLKSLETNIVLIAHSEGARYAQRCAARNVDKVAALILIEPAGAPTDLTTQEAHALSAVPTLSIWGDFIDQSDRWQFFRTQFEDLAERVAFRRHDCIILANHGLPGHSHFPMLDRNNFAVWTHVRRWIDDVTASCD